MFSNFISFHFRSFFRVSLRLISSDLGSVFVTFCFLGFCWIFFFCWALQSMERCFSDCVADITLLGCWIQRRWGREGIQPEGGWGGAGGGGRRRWMEGRSPSGRKVETSRKKERERESRETNKEMKEIEKERWKEVASRSGEECQPCNTKRDHSGTIIELNMEIHPIG